MKTEATNIFQCVEDLSLKAHVAARCASHLLKNEGSSCSRLSTMIEIIAALEKEKIELQKALEAERNQHVAARAEATSALEQNNTLKDKVAEL